ncbi:MAG: dual specificity protein phosphatase family protein [Myxococcota bacterium]
MVALFLLVACVPIDSAARPSPEGAWLDAGEEVSTPMMWGYSWVDDHLAVMPRPQPYDLPNIAADGVDLLVTLTESPLAAADLEAAGLESLHLPIPDYHAPSPEQVDVFVAAMESRVAAQQRVGVHCLAGRGRSGTMAAIWFVHEGLSAVEAIALIRELRPGSIETIEQEEVVVQYEMER